MVSVPVSHCFPPFPPIDLIKALVRVSTPSSQNSNIPKGWQTSASIIPAAPPAIKFVAADGGALPPGPAVVFADIFVYVL